MSTFFSSTDTQELKDGGNDTNHFVSLIVNNAGTYTAGITRKIKAVREVEETLVYSTWNDQEVTEKESYTEDIEYIQWFALNIEVEKITDTVEEEILGRIKEIKEDKSRKITSAVQTPYWTPSGGYNPNATKGGYEPFSKYVPPVSTPSYKPIEQEIPEQPTLPFKEEEPLNIPYGEVTLDTKIVNHVVNQILTLSVLASPEANTEKWLNNMEKIYDKRFANLMEFETFATNFIDFLINYTEDPKVSVGVTEMAAILAYDVTIKLEKLPKNKYIKSFISILDDYILM